MQYLPRTVGDLVGRLDGPLHFRFIFQPLMAALFAIRDGRRDARAERKPFRVITDPAQRRQVLLTTWKSVSKVFVVALVLDAVYQFKVFRWFYSGQALIVAMFPRNAPVPRASGSGQLAGEQKEGEREDAPRSVQFEKKYEQD